MSHTANCACPACTEDLLAGSRMDAIARNGNDGEHYAAVAEMLGIEATLAERGARYGDFADHAALAQGLQFRMQKFCLKADNEDGFVEPWRAKLNDVQRQALTVIADKIARILSGDPNYADNWHDIQGYAKLVEDRLDKENRNG